MLAAATPSEGERSHKAKKSKPNKHERKAQREKVKSEQPEPAEGGEPAAPESEATPESDRKHGEKDGNGKGHDKDGGKGDRKERDKTG